MEHYYQAQKFAEMAGAGLSGGASGGGGSVGGSYVGAWDTAQDPDREAAGAVREAQQAVEDIADAESPEEAARIGRTLQRKKPHLVRVCV